MNFSFPTDIILHPSMEGRDWDCSAVDTGKPVFITTEGRSTVVYFQRPFIPITAWGPQPSEGDMCPLYPLFINEAAYQSQGIAFVLYKKVIKAIV